jgi:hypothetical protein
MHAEAGTTVTAGDAKLRPPFHQSERGHPLRIPHGSERHVQRCLDRDECRTKYDDHASRVATVREGAGIERAPDQHHGALHGEVGHGDVVQVETDERLADQQRLPAREEIGRPME